MINLLILIGTLLMAVAFLTLTAVAWVKRHGREIHGSGSLGNAMQEIEGLFVESKAHVLRADRAEESDEEEGAGDPPEK